MSLVPLDIEIIASDRFSWRVRSSHFQMGTRRHREGSVGHRACGGRARAGPTAPSPQGWVWGDQPLLQDVSPTMKASAPRHYRRPGVGGEWALRKLGSPQARNPPCPPASVADVSSAPLDAEAGSGPALRPGSGCAVGNERRRKEEGRAEMELEGCRLHRPPQSWKLGQDRRLERGPPHGGWKRVSVIG